MIKVLNNPKLSKNFKLNEFSCNDNSKEIILEMELINHLQKLRYLLEKPIRIVSGYRNLKYNKKIGGASKSQHLLGKAADIKVKGIIPTDVAKAAEAVGFNGIGIYTHNGNYFVHVDVRDKKSYWKDSPSGKLIKIDKIEGSASIYVQDDESATPKGKNIWVDTVDDEQKYTSLEREYAGMVLKYDNNVKLLFEQLNSLELKIEAINNILKGE